MGFIRFNFALERQNIVSFSSKALCRQCLLGIIIIIKMKNDILITSSGRLFSNVKIMMLLKSQLCVQPAPRTAGILIKPFVYRVAQWNLCCLCQCRFFIYGTLPIRCRILIEKQNKEAKLLFN